MNTLLEAADLLRRCCKDGRYDAAIAALTNYDALLLATSYAEAYKARAETAEAALAEARPLLEAALSGKGLNLAAIGYSKAKSDKGGA